MLARDLEIQGTFVRGSNPNNPNPLTLHYLALEYQPLQWRSMKKVRFAYSPHLANQDNSEAEPAGMHSTLPAQAAPARSGPGANQLRRQLA